MKTTVNRLRRFGARRGLRTARSQRGTAMIIAIMIMSLLAIFVAASVSRVTNEALIMGNDQANTEAYFAAQASIEHVSRDFSEIFDVKITPAPSDITTIQNDKPAGFTNFQITQVLAQENPGAPPEQTVVDSGDEFAGLIALRDGWRIESTALNTNTGAEVRLTRTLNNYTIPIFQFGIFYDDPMEHHPGPPFAFGGRVHTNGDMYMMAGNDSTVFRDRVTAAGEIVTEVARNNDPWTNWGFRCKVNNGTSYVKVTQGSVKAGNSGLGGPDTPERIAAHGSDDPDLPNGVENANWSTFSAAFNGNLLANVRPLKLPLQLDAGGNKGPIEIIKRSVAGETIVVRDSRYSNKPGVRITLSDTQAQLPGGAGGVQLNAVNQPIAANTVGGGARGYWPSVRPGGAPRAVKVNGERLTPVANRQVWIKVESVNIDANLNPVATDITVPILSLGMTEPATFRTTAGADVTIGDANAIVKIQRFAIEGPPVKVNTATYFEDSAYNTPAGTAATNTAAYTALIDSANPRGAANTFRNVTTFVPAANGQLNRSIVTNDNWYVDGTEATFQYPTAGALPNLTTFTPRVGAAPNATATAGHTVIPFPIMMYDTREGLYNDSMVGGPNATANTWNNLYLGAGNRDTVPVMGVMGMIDFDVQNFKRLVEGQFDATLTGLTGASIPDNGGIGWIVYVSDRRGDRDNDGELDLENVYVSGPASQALGTEIKGEDVNHDGTVQANYDNAGAGNGEGATYNTAREADVAAVTDTPWFRRAQRLINGTALPTGIFKGFSFSSENGVYIKGNYNATGVAVAGGNGAPTPFNQYQNNVGTMVPASVVADAVSFLSNQWNDGKSFRWAFDFGPTNLDGRRPTADQTVRCALLMGDPISFEKSTGSNQGGGDWHLAGGVHNFIRFREAWGNTVNYCGSLINLFNSVDNTGPFKCCIHVYSPPTRNWVFDENFLDARKLPPGTPFFQYFNLTGFRRTYTQSS